MATQNKPVSSVSTARFTWDATRRQLVAEASDLRELRPERIYPDACDVGISLMSERTGDTAWFYLSHTNRDNEGDILWWEFKPTDEAIRRKPAMKGVVVVVYND